jgi:cobyrinic acid a,c-diamide synthase
MSRGCRGLVIAGVHSGVGKTTVALGLMAAYRRRGLTVQPFKVGPDFIDPGHHLQAAGRTSANLDGWMLPQAENLAIYHRHCRGAEIALVEGVMGLFDGYDGASEAGSTAQMAKWLGLPVVLVVDARSMARSAAAVAHGFATFDADLHLAGIIFNRVGSGRHLHYLQQAMTQVVGVTCLGGLPREQSLAIPERHLGLVTSEEHPLTPAYLAQLADVMEAHLDLEALLAIMAPVTLGEEAVAESEIWPDVRLGVARDQAFCFYYQENFRYLSRFGAELVPFSPLHDARLPEGLDGLYLGGGYPELFAKELAANTGMRKSIKEMALAGLPIYGECGGLMYLSQGLTTLNGERVPMAGVLPLEVRMLPRLKALGYRQVTLEAESLLGPAGCQGRGHEFHYSEITSEGAGLSKAFRLADRMGGAAAAEGYWVHRTLASYVHLHFGSNPDLARHLVEYCRRYGPAKK